MRRTRIMRMGVDKLTKVPQEASERLSATPHATTSSLALLIHHAIGGVVCGLWR